MKYQLYRVWYGEELAYIGRSTQRLNARLRSHFYRDARLSPVDIEKVTCIEVAAFRSKADMMVYEVYYINKCKPPLNRDDKAPDALHMRLKELEWEIYECPIMGKWREELRHEMN